MRLAGKLVDIYTEKIKPGYPSRVLVVVGAKIAKKAVSRNLIKRRLRAAFFFLKDKLQTQRIRLVARPGIVTARFADIKDELANLLIDQNEKISH